MKLKRLELQHFCQHASTSMNFGDGVIGIVGSNGAGKSNLIKGIRFAMLGDSGNAGAKADDMNWAAPSADKGGSAKLMFEHAGEPGVVSRSITTARASLKYVDRNEKSVSAVNPAMLEIAGLPKKVIQDVIFVLQGEMEGILFEEAADRKKKFHGLFGIDKAEPLRVILQRELADVGEAPSDERLKELQAQLDTQVDPQLRELRTQQGTLAQSLAGIDTVALQAIIDASVSRKELVTERLRLEARAQDLQAQVVGHVETNSVPDHSAALAELAEQINTLQTEVATLKGRAERVAIIERLEAQRTRLSEILKIPEPQVPPLSMAIDDAIAERDCSCRQLMPKQAFVKAFKDADGPAPCPTCGETVEDATARVAQFTQEIESITEAISAVDELIAQARVESERYTREKVQWDTTHKSAVVQLAEIEEQLRMLGTGETVRVDSVRLEQANQRLAELRSKEQQLRADEKAANDRNVELASLKGKLTEVTQALNENTTKLAATPPITDEDAALARQQLSDSGQWQVKLAGIEGQLKQLQDTRAAVVADMDRLQQQIAQSENLLKYRTYCERARTIFHHDCLPMMVTQAYLASLNAKINEYLKTFNAPFTCTIKDDLAVVCNIKGGERSAQRLSGGQKVMLGISFRFAIYSLFAASFGFMVLDEPTAYLDEDSVDSVVELLQQVRQYAHSTGMQLIVVTHEPKLTPAFDHVSLIQPS